ncbi:hypothetical protein TNCV_635611 [Trichonephila clavipes]|nr:hypothetical protein TNCV_635611 [Trichonephila clavipes]
MFFFAEILFGEGAYWNLYSPKNLEFWTICQLAAFEDRRPSTGLGLPPYTIITHSVKRQQSVEPVCTIMRSILCVCSDPVPPEVSRRPCIQHHEVPSEAGDNG